MRFRLIYFFTLLIAVVNALNSAELLAYQKKSSSNVIKLTQNNFKKILSGPSDSYVLVLLTSTSSKFNCIFCQTIQPEFNKLADSWAKDHPKGDGLFFARADLADGHLEIFKAFQLDVIPQIYLYSPSEDAHSFNHGFEILSATQNPLNFASHIVYTLKEKTGLHLIIYEPTNYGSVITTAIVTILVLFAAKKNKNSILIILGSRPVWGGITVLSILFFVTGHMFNSIRSAPHFRSSPDGSIQYFAKDQQSQFGAETQAMAFIYAILVLSVVSLVTKVNSVTNSKVQLFVVSALLGLIIIFYSILLSIFKYKSPGYPLQLLSIWSP